MLNNDFSNTSKMSIEDVLFKPLSDKIMWVTLSDELHVLSNKLDIPLTHLIAVKDFDYSTISIADLNKLCYHFDINIELKILPYKL